MKKIETEYFNEYDNISNDKIKRLSEMIAGIKEINKLKEHINFINNIKWNSINFIIYLVPKATPRPRYNFIKNTFYVHGSKDNKDIFYKYFKDTDISIIKTPCKFT